MAGYMNPFMNNPAYYGLVQNPPNQQNFMTYPQAQPTPQSDGLIYVHGIEGANAYQLPNGVLKQTLWDDTDDCFYVKGYDSTTGRPRVLAWNDYMPHQASDPAKEKADADHYVTKEDVKELLAEFDLSNLVTKSDLDKILGKLKIGNNGRIVRSNEHDA